MMWGIFWFAVFLWVLLFLFSIEREKQMYVYRIMDGMFVVGHYDPATNKFIAEGDYTTRDEAAGRVHYLNGGNKYENII